MEPEIEMTPDLAQKITMLLLKGWRIVHFWGDEWVMYQIFGQRVRELPGITLDQIRLWKGDR